MLFCQGVGLVRSSWYVSECGKFGFCLGLSWRAYVNLESSFVSLTVLGNDIENCLTVYESMQFDFASKDLFREVAYREDLIKAKDKKVHF